MFPPEVAMPFPKILPGILLKILTDVYTKGSEPEWPDHKQGLVSHHESHHKMSSNTGT